MTDSTGRGWTDEAELLTQALEAGSGPLRDGWQDPDENVVVVDGTIRAAAWDEGYERGVAGDYRETVGADTSETKVRGRAGGGVA